MNREKMTQAIEKIAKETLGIDELRARNSDGQDFYDLAIWSIELALIQAYKSGMNAAKETRH